MMDKNIDELEQLLHRFEGAEGETPVTMKDLADLTFALHQLAEFTRDEIRKGKA